MPIIIILGFGFNLIFSQYSIFEKKFWTFGYQKATLQDHDFPALLFHTQKAVNAYLHKSDGTREEFETFLFYAINRYHCIETITKNCNEFRFHEMKKEYSFFINLEMTEDEIRENNIDLSSIEARLNKLLQIYRIMGSPRFSPKLYFPYE